MEYKRFWSKEEMNGKEQELQLKTET
jgi:hypothetical protein